MSKFILIKNKGELEVEGLKLLGASSKRGDRSKIGSFGSGIKYAIAYLLRESQEFRLFSGLSEVVFTTREAILRDQSFQQVVINGEETSITTAWGEDWQEWQIFREIVATAIDEGAFSIEDSTTIQPQVEDETHFYIPYTKFSQFYSKLSHYFNLEVVSQTENSLIKKDGASDLIVFKQGVRVIKDGQKSSFKLSLYNYNLPNISLKEDRIADHWDIQWEVGRVLVALKDKDIIRRIYKLLLGGVAYLETDLLTQHKQFEPLSEEWLEVINGSESKIIRSSHSESIEKMKGETFALDNQIEFVSSQFMDLVETSFGDEFKNTYDPATLNLDYEILETTDRERKLINMCVNKIEEVGLDIHAQIKVVDFCYEGKRSSIQGITILLSRAIFDLGIHEILKFILKESIKIKNDLSEHDPRKFAEVMLKITTRFIMEKNL